MLQIFICILGAGCLLLVLCVNAVQNAVDAKKAKDYLAKEAPFFRLCPVDTPTPKPTPAPTPKPQNDEGKDDEEKAFKKWLKKNAENLLTCLEMADESFTITEEEYEGVNVNMITDYLLSLDKISSVCCRDGNIICSIEKATV